jgi:hypothetical protein
MTDFPDKKEVEATAKWYRGFLREVKFVLALPALAAACMIAGYYFFGG